MAIFPCEDVRIQASSVLRAWLLLLWEKEWQKGLQGAAWPDLVRAELWPLLSLLHGYARVEVSTRRVQSSCVERRASDRC